MFFERIGPFEEFGGPLEPLTLVGLDASIEGLLGLLRLVAIRLGRTPG